MVYLSCYAGVMELADVRDSKSRGGNTVWVRPPSPAPLYECGQGLEYIKRINSIGGVLNERKYVGDIITFGVTVSGNVFLTYQTTEEERCV